MSHILDDLKAFLDSSPTSWHAVKEIGERLAIRDFSPLSEDEKWQLEKGKKYFVIRGGALCAFQVPTAKPTRAKILAAHTDSPALKLKPRPEIVKENMTLFCTEVYGGPLLSSWFNRDLGIAGRVVIETKKGEMEEKLIFIDDTPVFIPQLAIHLDREIHEKGLHINKQEHLNPIISLGEAVTLESLLRRHMSFQSLLSFELFLIPIEPARYLGANGEMIGSYRLDNLSSAHACASAIALAKSEKQVLQMSVFWDNEEIGSRSDEGADSPFVKDILKRICLSLKESEEDYYILKKNSLCVSVDVAHAFNPNFPKKYDPNHHPLLGKGIVIKHNADKKYASDALSVAAIVKTCKEQNLPYQSYAGRSDMPSGSTVGPIMAHTLGIPTVDIGCAQLSMHSTREVISCQDYMELVHLLTHVLQEG